MLRMHVPKLEPDLSDLEKYDLLSYLNFMRRSATYSNSPVILVKLPREFGMLFTGKAEEYLNNKKLKNDEFCRVKLNPQESLLDQRIITLFKMETKTERKPSPTFPKDHFKNNENNPNLIFDKSLESYVLRKTVDPRKYFQSEYHKEHNVFNYAQDLEDSLMEQSLKKHPIFHSWNLNKLDNPLKIVMPVGFFFC
uniref:Uncharacterized protein n=1 Tax=Panagrolaimus sp. JU765 TaxID=591449 RepID=A0AC34RQV3_9BILA